MYDGAVEQFTPEELNELVSPTDLLDLQTVVSSPAAVSMLRRRHEGFPKPRAVSGRTPLFRLGDVVEWFQDERGVQLQPVREEWRLARAMKALQVDHPLPKAREFAVGVLATCGSQGVDARRLLDDGDVFDVLREIARSVDPEAVGHVLATLLGAIPGDRVAVRFVDAVARRLAAGSAPLDLEDEILQGLASVATPATTTSPHVLIDLMVAVADPDGVDSIYDPTCGEAGLLLTAGAETGWTAQLAGRESEPGPWRIAHARAHLRGVQLDLGAEPQESQVDDRVSGSDAALVVCDPPFVGRGYVRWIRHALDNVRPKDGRAVVCLPARTLEPGRRESRSTPVGRVEAVVACPSIREDTAERVVIWSVTSAPNDSILIVDATDPATSADAVRQGLRHWRSTGVRPPGIPCEVILAGDRDSPSLDLRPPTMRRGPEDPKAALERRAGELASELLGLAGGDLEDAVTAEERRVLERLVRRLRKAAAVPSGET